MMVNPLPKGLLPATWDGAIPGTDGIGPEARDERGVVIGVVISGGKDVGSTEPALQSALSSAKTAARGAVLAGSRLSDSMGAANLLAKAGWESGEPRLR